MYVGRSYGYTRVIHVSASTRQTNNVFIPAVGDRDSYDLRQNSSALFPPEYYLNYLNIPEVMIEIGAETTYEECPDAPYELFVKTGDVCYLALDARQCVRVNACSIGRTNVASSALRVGKFWHEDFNLGMQTR